MKERYNKVFSEIAPKRSNEELYQAVMRKAENNMEKKRISRKAVIIPMAAALALTVSAVGVTAALNSEHLRSVFGGNESIVENIHSHVFEDSDEHVKLTVEEYLSDGQCTYLTVHYQALDEEGEQWLAEEQFLDEYSSVMLSVHPEFKASFEVFYPKNYSVNAMELKEFATDTDKYFNVFFEATSRFYGTEMAEFRYVLTDGGSRSTILDISDNVEAKWFELNAESSPSEFYIPKYLVLSDLSFSIHGENTGAFEDNSIPGVMWSFQSFMTNEEANADAVNHFSFVFADGSEYRPDGYSYLCSSTASEENRYTDIDIASGCFVQRDYNNGFVMDFEAVDVDNIVGLKFGDVYYELSAE